MSKVMILDDLQETVQLLAPPLIGQGHEVLTDISPIDFERLMTFRPDVITVNLYRRLEAFDRPITNMEADVIGFEPLVEMERYPAVSLIPIILLGNCLQEKDVPTTVNYDLFLSIPRDIALYIPKVIEIATTVKSRRRISRYTCPKCRSRLTHTDKWKGDLFCPRCHTAVAIIDEDRCIAQDSDGEQIACTMEILTPPAPLPLKTHPAQGGETPPDE